MAKGWQNAGKRWEQAMQSASTAYGEGIDSVTVNPMEKAAQNEAGYLQGVNDAVSSGKWAAGLRRVTLSDWKTNAKTKGAQRLAAGAKAAVNKVQQFWQRWGPVQDQIVQAVRAMPNATFADRMARMQANAQASHDAAQSRYS